MVKNLPAALVTWVQSLGREDSPGERAWQPTLVFLPSDFLGPFSMGKNIYLHFFPKIKVGFY